MYEGLITNETVAAQLWCTYRVKSYFHFLRFLLGIYWRESMRGTTSVGIPRTERKERKLFLSQILRARSVKMHRRSIDAYVVYAVYSIYFLIGKRA
jgi:hypothetical protein